MNEKYQQADLARDEAQINEKNKRAFWYNALQGLLYLHDYDLYGVYKTQQHEEEEEEANKTTANRSKYGLRSLYLEPELQLVRTKEDALRHRRTQALRLFVSYFFIKASIVSLAQYTLLNYEYLVPRTHQAPLLSRPWAELILNTLGNPLYVLRDFAVIFYAFPAGLSVLNFVWLPQRYKRKPLNVAVLRFFQSPGHELKRIDLNIDRKLSNLRSSLRVYWFEKRHQLVRQTRGSIFVRGTKGERQLYSSRGQKSSLCLNELLKVEEAYCSHLRQFLVHLSPALKHPTSRAYGSLRPATYGAAYYFESVKNLTSLLVGTNVFYFVCCGVIISFMQVNTFNYKCELYRQKLTTSDVCNPFKIYTLAEGLILLELPVIMLLSLWVSALNLALHTLAMKNQTELIASIQQELSNCKNFILHYKQHFIHSSSCIPKLCINGENKQLIWQTLEHRLKLDKYLLHSLVRLLVCENELLDNSENISELSLLVMYYAFGTTIYAILGGRLGLKDTFFIRQFIVGATWLNFNLVAIACAHVYARIVQFERTMWLVLAANASTFTQTLNYFNLPRDEDLEQQDGEEDGEDDDDDDYEKDYDYLSSRSCSFASDLWIKFVTATSINMERYCARPLALRLTYQMIIELNFFAIFAYSLSIGYR